MENRKLKWFGNLSRINYTLIPKMAYEWKLNGKRRRVRTNVVETANTSDYDETGDHNREFSR